MDIYVGYAFSLKAWRLMLASGCKYEYFSRSRIVEPETRVRVIRADAEAYTCLCRLGTTGQSRIDLLCADDNHRNTFEEIKFHTWSQRVPPCSFVRVEGWPQNLLFSSPEFCLLQMASSLELPALVKHAMDACGRYASGRQRPPHATTLARLLSYAASLKGQHGSERFKQSLEYVTENSWSHGETVLALMLFLPEKMGGLHPMDYRMNERLHVPDALLGYMGQGSIIPDIHPVGTRVLIKYDGKQDHSSMIDVSHDRKWDITAEKMGYVVRSFSGYTLADPEEFRCVADEMFAQMGVYLPRYTRSQLAAQEHLRKTLLPLMGISV